MIWIIRFSLTLLGWVRIVSSGVQEVVAVTGKVSWRRGRALVLAGAVAVSVAAGGFSSVGAAAASRPSAASAAVLGSGRSEPRAAVPWRQVGSGWVLALYWPGRYPASGTALAAVPVLYLIDPAGSRYQLYQWPVTENPPRLVDWSADKTDALVSLADGTLEQVDLVSGAVSSLPLPSQVQVIGYSRPGGRGLIGWRRAYSHWQLAQYSLSGRRIKVLLSPGKILTVVYSQTGTELAASSQRGLWLASDQKDMFVTLPVPARFCFPVRWWDSRTILASCQATVTSRNRLWLVPVGGGKPTPLTTQRGSKSADPGDIGAWQLPGHLYLQALTSSGSGLIFTQAANGQAARITVPHTSGDNWIMTARGSQLLLRTQTRCSDHQSLLWFNPATRHEQPLLTTPPGLVGVLGAIPYGSPTANLDIQVVCG
jgi:TolB protein